METISERITGVVRLMIKILFYLTMLSFLLSSTVHAEELKTWEELKDSKPSYHVTPKIEPDESKWTSTADLTLFDQ